MNLREFCDKLDWSEVDEVHRKWEKDHPDSLRIEDVANQRMERVYMGLQALWGEGDMRSWWAIPQPIREQIRTLAIKEGLIEGRETSRRSGDLQGD